jgi:hypothetical protein
VSAAGGRDVAPEARPSVDAATVAAKLAALRERIATAGGDPEVVRIVAVTKGFGTDAVRAALAAGLYDLGENYAQELLAKAPAGGDARWHFIGPVQRNKVASLAGYVTLWQSVDRLEVAEAIARRQPGGRVLVQVNSSGEISKHGCRLDQAPDLVDAGRRLGLDVAGLMTIGPLGPPERARRGFRDVAALQRRLGLVELSMGMTADLEIAVEEGATMVRIGRALFGARPRTASPATIGSLNGGK